MIGDVRVANWKRHLQFEHSFAPGINFVLGANGMGKTSLLQAIRFGLFGADDSRDAREAIRFDATSASVQVELLGDEPAVVGRSVDTRGRMTETLNVASATSADDLLRSRFGADPAFLRSLVFLSEGDVYAPGAGNVGLDQQLESLLSMRGLTQLSGEIRRARGPLSKEQRSQRTALQFSRDEIAHLTQDEARLRTELEQLRSEEAELQEHYLAAADRARDREQWTRLQADIDTWQGRVAEVARSAGLSLGDDELEQSLVELDRRRESLEEALRSLTQQVGELVGRMAAIRSFLGQLDQGEMQLCPLCRQSLDEAHRGNAIAEHNRELEAFAAQEEATRAHLVQTQADLERARATSESARRVWASRPAGPPPGPPPAEDAVAQLQSSQEAVESLRTRRALVEQELLETRERLATAEASRRLEDQVTAAFREDALLEAAASGIQEFLADVRKSVMAPLAEELGQQWKAYRPDAEWSLALDDAGAICLARDGLTRPYSVLSGGEKTVAIVLLRVAMLTALTTSDVIVLDEPLEHLDPRARRLMVSSLHHAVRKGLLNQIIISTYEESLVRRLLTHSDVHAVWLD
jgi:DNA repair exonuclease SbcCD ATPase subunit